MISADLDSFIFRCRRACLLAGLGLALPGFLVGCDNSNVDSVLTVSPFEATVPKEFVSHHAREGRVTIRTPVGWSDAKTEGPLVLNLRTDHPGESLNLLVVPATAGESLDRILVRTPEELRHEFADFNLEKFDMIFLDETPAGRIVYQASRGGFHGKLMQIFIRRHSRDFTLTYTAPPEQFDANRATLDQVVASIQID